MQGPPYYYGPPDPPEEDDDEDTRFELVEPPADPEEVPVDDAPYGRPDYCCGACPQVVPSEAHLDCRACQTGYDCVCNSECMPPESR